CSPPRGCRATGRMLGPGRRYPHNQEVTSSLPPTESPTEPPTDQRPPHPSRPPGLRERKKAQTRASIQVHALRLCKGKGYAVTTMEPIAAAAEISPSTPYRYFPTKEELVLADDYDPLVAAAVRAQPPGLSPFAALKNGIAQVLAGISAEEIEQLRE